MFNLWVCQCVIMKNCFPGDNYCSGNYHKSTSECFGRCLYVCLCTDFVNTAVSQSYSIKLQRFTDVMLSSKRRQELKMCVVWPIEGLPGAMTASQNTTFFLSLNMFVAPWLSVFHMKVWYLLVTADVVLTLLYLSLCVRLRVCVCVCVTVTKCGRQDNVAETTTKAFFSASPGVRLCVCWQILSKW